MKNKVYNHPPYGDEKFNYIYKSEEPEKKLNKEDYKFMLKWYTLLIMIIILVVVPWCIGIGMIVKWKFF